MIVVGIDPGLQGYVAVLNDGGYEPMLMPLAKNGEIDLMMLKHLFQEFPIDIVYLEQQHPRPGNSASSMFTIGKNYGKLLAIIELYGKPLVIVSPVTWQKGIIIGKRDKNQIKDVVAKVITDRYPNCIVHKRTGAIDYNKTDALGIAFYGLKKEKVK